MRGKRVGGYAGKGVSAGVVGWLAAMLRGISGMPRYEEYTEHLHRCHPERRPLSEREYYDEYLRTRYGDGSTRCC